MDEKIRRLEERVDALEKRLAVFERSGAGEETLLVAPVRIVDEAGALIAEIDSELTLRAGVARESRQTLRCSLWLLVSALLWLAIVGSMFWSLRLVVQ